jgi:hypothetical protein
LDIPRAALARPSLFGTEEPREANGALRERLSECRPDDAFYGMSYDPKLVPITDEDFLWQASAPMRCARSMTAALLGGALIPPTDPPHDKKWGAVRRPTPLALLAPYVVEDR